MPSLTGQEAKRIKFRETVENILSDQNVWVWEKLTVISFHQTLNKFLHFLIRKTIHFCCRYFIKLMDRYIWQKDNHHMKIQLQNQISRTTQFFSFHKLLHKQIYYSLSFKGKSSSFDKLLSVKHFAPLILNRPKSKVP